MSCVLFIGLVYQLFMGFHQFVLATDTAYLSLIYVAVAVYPFMRLISLITSKDFSFFLIFVNK